MDPVQNGNHERDLKAMGSPRRSRYGGWVALAVALLVVSYWAGSRAMEGPSRLRVSFSPFFLDPGLLRRDRFDRHVAVQPPDLNGRRQILEVHTRGVDDVTHHLTEHRDQLDSPAEALLEHETPDQNDAFAAAGIVAGRAPTNGAVALAAQSIVEHP